MKYSILIYALILLLSACGPFGASKDKDEEEQRLANHPEFIAKISNFGELIPLVDAFIMKDAQFRQTYKDKSTLDDYELIKERHKQGFCFVKNDTYVGATDFQISALKKSGLPDDQQKNCLINFHSYAEKKQPTAGVYVWERRVQFSDYRKNDKVLREIDYTITTNEDPALGKPRNFTLRGHMPNVGNLQGSALIRQSSTANHVDYSGTFAIDFGLGKGTSELRYEITFSLVGEIIKEKYLLDDVEKSRADLGHGFIFLFKLYAWDWPNKGP